jgi:hypothetical protein
MRSLLLATVGLVLALPAFAGQDCHLEKHGAAYNLICKVSPPLGGDPGYSPHHRVRYPDVYRDNTGIVPPHLRKGVDPDPGIAKPLDPGRGDGR